VIRQETLRKMRCYGSIGNSFTTLIITIIIINEKIRSCISLSQSSSSSSSNQMSRDRLSSVLSSLSGKLTLSPEIIIPEPTDPTALLLQNDKITKLSESIRTKAKANAAFVSASTITSLQSFILEQEESRGNFPGPVPVVYCYDSTSSTSMSLKDISNAGVEGILLPLLSDNTIIIDSIDALQSYSDDIDQVFMPKYKEALECGLQCIPEITLDGAGATNTWTEENVLSIVDFLKQKCSMVDHALPAALILSMQAELQTTDHHNDSKETTTDENEPILNLPQIPKSLKKQIPILGSVRVLAGENRMGWYISKLKNAGYVGAFLRADCVPGFRLNPDLQQVSSFWSACIGDLKSTKSKHFGFRAKINTLVDRDIPMEWYNLQKDVMSSGALGSESHASMDDMDPSGGDFKGF